MNPDNLIDELLKKPICEISPNFTSDFMREIAKIDEEENFTTSQNSEIYGDELDLFINNALSKTPNLQISHSFTEDTLRKSFDLNSETAEFKHSRKQILGNVFVFFGASVAACAALFLGAFSLPSALEMPGGGHLGSYAQMSEFSEEISSLQLVILQEEYLETFNL